jgi:CheY-like chemotaxis protein
MDASWSWNESRFEAAFRPTWLTIREATQKLVNLVGSTGLSGMSLGESLIGGPELSADKPIVGQAATCDFTPMGEDSGPKTLLLIDDPVQQALAEHALTEHGFRVDVVHTGPRTYYSVMLREYELIVVDVDLADDEGFDTIEVLRLLPQGISNTTGLFALSRARSPEAVLRSTQLGVDGFFVKPLTAEALRAAFEGHREADNAFQLERETVGI